MHTDERLGQGDTAGVSYIQYGVETCLLRKTSSKIFEKVSPTDLSATRGRYMPKARQLAKSMAEKSRLAALEALLAKVANAKDAIVAKSILGSACGFHVLLMLF